MSLSRYSVHFSGVLMATLSGFAALFGWSVVTQLLKQEEKEEPNYRKVFRRAGALGFAGYMFPPRFVRKLLNSHGPQARGMVPGNQVRIRNLENALPPHGEPVVHSVAVDLGKARRSHGGRSREHVHVALRREAHLFVHGIRRSLGAQKQMPRSLTPEEIVGDAYSMRFVCGSLAVFVAGLECAVAFFPGTSYLVATHGAVLGTTWASRAKQKRADAFHAVALMSALAVEFFVIMANTNFSLNYFASMLVALHMLWFLVWSGAQKKGESGESMKWGCARALETALEMGTIIGCAIVDCSLAPHVGFVTLQPGEILAPTFLGALAVTCALPFLRLRAHHHDVLSVTLLLSVLLTLYASLATVQAWYVQCAYLWSLLGFVLLHCAASFCFVKI